MVEVTEKAASKVETRELPPVPEEAVVTSDLPKAEPETDKEPVTDPSPKGENPEAEATGDKPEGPNDQASATDDPTTSKPPRNKRRWDKLLAKLGKAEEALTRERESGASTRKQIDDLKETVTALRAKVERPPVQKKKPQLAEFDEPEQYAAAFADWKKSQEVPTPEPKKAEEPADPPQSTLDPDKLAAFHKAGKKFGDTFAEAVQDDSLKISPAMAEYMVDSKHGAAIMVHLSNNPDEARTIHAEATPLDQFKAMQILASKAGKKQLDLDTDGLDFEGGDDKLNPDDKPDDSPGTNTTKAPAPPSNSRDTGIPQIIPDPEKEAMDDYAARRQREELQKRGVILK